jgi:hypothetical protein
MLPDRRQRLARPRRQPAAGREASRQADGNVGKEQPRTARHHHSDDRTGIRAERHANAN